MKTDEEPIMPHSNGVKQRLLFTVGIMVLCVAVSCTAQHITFNYARFRGATEPDTMYACERDDGIPCQGSARAPETNWFVNYHSSSKAEVGSLEACADVYLTGDGSLGPLQGVGGLGSLASIGGRAGIVDTLTIHGGTGAGVLTLYFSVSGTVGGSGGTNPLGRPHFQYVPVIAGQSRFDLSTDFFFAGFEQPAAVTIPFTFDVPLSFAVNFYGLAQIIDWVPGAAAHADVRAVVTRIAVAVNGQIVPDFSVDAASGNTYSATGISPTGIPPGLRPPTDHPPAICVGGWPATCLHTWGAVAEANTGRPLHMQNGWATTGILSNGHRDWSELAAATVAYPSDSDVSVPAACVFFEGFPSLATRVQVVDLGPMSCVPGTVTQSMYASSEFGRLRAYAGLGARNVEGTLALTSYGAAYAYESIQIQTDSPSRVFPGAQSVVGLTNDRVVRFTFRVDGHTGATADEADAAAGFFMRYSGGPCPSPGCAHPFRPWVSSSAGRLVQFDVEYDHRYPLSLGVQFVAAASATAFERDSQTSYSASVAANFSSTAELVGIQAFEGTIDDLGSEITDFRVLSASGTQYNASGAVLEARIGIRPKVVSVSGAEKLAVDVLEGDGFDPSDVDPESLTLGVIGTERSLIGCDAIGSHRQAEPKPGRAKKSKRLSCRFKRELTGLTADSPVAVLQGRLLDGRPFQATATLGVRSKPRSGLLAKRQR